MKTVRWWVALPFCAAGVLAGALLSALAVAFLGPSAASAERARDEAIMRGDDESPSRRDARRAGARPAEAPRREGRSADTRKPAWPRGETAGAPEPPRLPSTEPRAGATAESREVEPGVWEISQAECDRVRDRAEDLLGEADVSTYVNETTHEVEGMLVEHIDAGSLIGKRGLVEGDLVRSVNGTPIASKSELIELAKRSPEGLRTIHVNIERNGKRLTLEYRVSR